VGKEYGSRASSALGPDATDDNQVQPKEKSLRLRETKRVLLWQLGRKLVEAVLTSALVRLPRSKPSSTRSNQ